MYNWFAQCQRLLTPARLALATAFTTAVAFTCADAFTAAALLALCCAAAAVAWQYSHQIIGGVVGDFLGATIAVVEILVYMALAVDWERAAESGAAGKCVVLGAVATLPVMYSRRIVDYNASC
jgi:predicted secreted Zn-dependent protease